MPTTQIPAHQFDSVSFPSYAITYEPITDRLTRIFDPVELKAYLVLYGRAQECPKEAQLEVKKWFKKYPNLPELYNLMSYIYVRQKKIRKAEKLIKENFVHNSQNLFAKINYADQCLRKGKLSQIPFIFNHIFDLNKLYPERKTFHFSELIGFMTLMGFYYLSLGKREMAKDYCAYAKLLDPEDTTVRHLIKKLSEKKLLSHLLDQFQKKTLKTGSK